MIYLIYIDSFWKDVNKGEVTTIIVSNNAVNWTFIIKYKR